MPFDGEMLMRNIIKHMYMYSLVPRPFLPPVLDRTQPGNEAIHGKTKSPMMQRIIVLVTVYFYKGICS